VRWKENYAPFGQRQVNASASQTNRQWFGDKYEDRETGLSYFGARYYDPVVGRFMGVDPKAFSAEDIYSFNRYAYANDNPHKFVDPDGKNPVLLWLIRATGAGYAAGVLADAAGQYAAWGSVDWGLAMASSAAKAGAEAGLFGPIPGGGAVALTIEPVAAIAAKDAGRIAAGHAFEKHVLNQGEFKGLDIRTRDQFTKHIEDVINNPTATKSLERGRTAYWQEETGTVVIRDPKHRDAGTAFQPKDGRRYFDEILH